ncbi:MAG: type II toxin-antitoxin system PemK/MazF family toxin [Ardenticatenaceae bacterium]|nr:type II toxin-antitoxin system PemK/MazF family toxin [Ardenticatenaceae bacterium]
MKRGDIFDARLNPTEGSEQAGTRPVIVVSRDAINQFSSVIVVVPLTSAKNIKRSFPNNVLIKAGNGGLTADSVALGGQVRAITKARLLRQRGSLPQEVMKQIDQILRITLDL